MRPAVLRSNYENSKSPYAAFDVQPDPAPYLGSERFEFGYFDILPADVAGQLRRIDALFQPDVYINLCQGGLDEGRAGPLVPAALGAPGHPFTGASAFFYNVPKVETKVRMISAGIATPRYVVARTDEDMERARTTLRFPLFVEHHDGYNSVSVSPTASPRCPSGSTPPPVGSSPHTAQR